MKKLVYLFALTAIGFTSCGDDTETIIIDSSMPDGTFTASKSGSIVEQNDTGTAGMVSLGTDTKSVQFLKFGSDFTSSFATGTVTVYLSTSAELVFSPGTGNPDIRLIGPISKAGENYFKLDPAAAAKFTHVIVWCGSAGIPFGYAALN